MDIEMLNNDILKLLKMSGWEEERKVNILNAEEYCKKRNIELHGNWKKVMRELSGIKICYRYKIKDCNNNPDISYRDYEFYDFETTTKIMYTFSADQQDNQISDWVKENEIIEDCVEIGVSDRGFYYIIMGRSGKFYFINECGDLDFTLDTIEEVLNRMTEGYSIIWE